MKYTIEDAYAKGDEYQIIPRRTMSAMLGYIKEGRSIGDFLTAVFSNKLNESFAYADLENRIALHEITLWIFNHAPRMCWGSAERVKAWEGL